MIKDKVGSKNAVLNRHQKAKRRNMEVFVTASVSIVPKHVANIERIGT